jgi:predicted dehydrogenase
MAKKLKVGIIGVGGIAGAHFPGWRDSPHADLVALADIEPKALKRRGQEWGVSLLYERPKDLIANPEIDIVDVCTPNRYHMPWTVAALEGGKHVICEKPLAPTPAEIRKMIAARDKSRKLLMTAQHFRFQGSAQALKAELDKGILGEIYHARSWMLRRSAAPTRPGFILKKHSGGGPCIDIGVHILDLTLWMLGHPKPVAVSGITQDRLAHQKGAFSNWGGAIPKEFDVEDFAAAFVRFANGTTLVIEVSWLLHHKTSGEDMQMWLYGEKGGAHWPSNELLSAANDTRQLLNTQLQNAEGGAPHAKECMAFAEAVLSGKPSPVPPEQSLDVIAILDGLYRSAAAGKEVRLNY